VFQNIRNALIKYWLFSLFYHGITNHNFFRYYVLKRYLIKLQQFKKFNKKYIKMGTTTYVKGGGSHHNVPVPLTSKIDLYRSSKKIDSFAGASGGTMNRVYEQKSSKRIEWDIHPIR
jgi:hypothetical protein